MFRPNAYFLFIREPMRNELTESNERKLARIKQNNLGKFVCLAGCFSPYTAIHSLFTLNT